MIALVAVKVMAVFSMPIVLVAVLFVEMVQYPNATVQDMLLWIYKNLKDAVCGMVA